MQRVFLYSDPHFGHGNILSYEPRPFSSVEEMDVALIENWNHEVRRDDLVIVLGDFAFLNKEKTKTIAEQLKGKKWLIRGDHDRGRSRLWFLEIGFDQVFDFPIIYKKQWILSHEPVPMVDSMPYVNLHGHMHSKTMGDSKHINLSVEHWDYRPVLFDDVVQRSAQRGL